eukprot:CAMPEP_0203886190 /NCGR_PEP_ID=MMETSP0359-20131031/30031_1 /ASSEMBLY_ACC=CAM_ASM_000338 /TAXON_ID=268821 /ORGANISM="Scrippsiella Hangoei, Strain SHTV-5" /LENGTH=48 /DNA_ID= /DNA_START= /DNA_END= /DNA_ORIENTATION=
MAGLSKMSAVPRGAMALSASVAAAGHCRSQSSAAAPAFAAAPSAAGAG